MLKSPKSGIAVICCTFMFMFLFLLREETRINSLTKALGPSNGMTRNAVYSSSGLDQSEETREDDDDRDLTGFQENYDEYGDDYNVEDEDDEENEAPIEEANADSDDMKLRSYTYSNCPLVMAKFNQFLLSTDGPFTSEVDERINSNIRAEMALDLVNDNKAYERVVAAFESGAFNRTIVLDGDSLTRQLFISLGCLAWTAGYVEDVVELVASYGSKGINNILNNAHYSASSTFFDKGHIKFKGGGDLYYIANPKKKKIDILSKRMIRHACNMHKSRYLARIGWGSSWGSDLLPLQKKDVVVLAAGHHEERSFYMSTYKRFFQCISDDEISGDYSLSKWPKFFYQMSSAESFWTEDGTYNTPLLPDKDPMSCQPSTAHAVDREEEADTFSDLVPLLGKDIDMKKLGEYHVGHGDCLHWIQPGVPDLQAAELADSLASPSKEEDTIS